MNKKFIYDYEWEDFSTFVVIPICLLFGYVFLICVQTVNPDEAFATYPDVITTIVRIGSPFICAFLSVKLTREFFKEWAKLTLDWAKRFQPTSADKAIMFMYWSTDFYSEHLNTDLQEPHRCVPLSLVYSITAILSCLMLIAPSWCILFLIISFILPPLSLYFRYLCNKGYIWCHSTKFSIINYNSELIEARKWLEEYRKDKKC